jgi:signal transduction histidine kinase
MDAELRYNLFLSLKEALNNVVKHAHATEVRIELRLEKDSFTLTVQDNGQGMPARAPNRNGTDVGVSKTEIAPSHETSVAESQNSDNGATISVADENDKPASDQNGNGHRPASARHGDRLTSGHGLVNMDHRLRSVGGRCLVQGSTGEGTRIEMTVRVKTSVSPIMAIGSAEQVPHDNGGR